MSRVTRPPQVGVSVGAVSYRYCVADEIDMISTKAHDQRTKGSHSLWSEMGVVLLDIRRVERMVVGSWRWARSEKEGTASPHP
jgi:hypothetical protein